MGLWISFPTLAGQQTRTQGLYSSLFSGPDSAWVCTEFSAEATSFALQLRGAVGYSLVKWYCIPTFLMNKATGLLCKLSTVGPSFSSSAIGPHSFRELLPIFLVRLGQVIVVQSLSCVWLFAYPQISECQASLSFTISRVCSNPCPLSWWVGFHPRVGKILWRRTWQPTPVFLPGESHKQRSLVGYSP